MRDDEIIDAYERELSDPGGDGRREAPTPRPSNRGFWIVIGTIGLAALVLIFEILANQPIARTIGHAQYDLRLAQAAAEAIRADTGSFAGADADALNARGLEEGLVAVGPDRESAGLSEVSVLAQDDVWAVAVTANPGACFYLKLVAGADEPLYGVGEVCTAREALSAADTRW